MILTEVVRKIAPENIDPQMLSITGWYITGLLVVFVIALILIVLPVLTRWVRLVSLCGAIRNVRKLQKGDLQSVRHSIQDKFIGQIGWAKDGFQSFHLAWQEARPQGENNAILPIRLREFLSPEVVLDGARNRRLAEALPGIFVAMGIFGTFLGLVLGLQDLEFGKLNNLQEGVGHLISGLSLAFLTSLGGIALSIVFSFIYRFSITRLERSSLALDNLLSEIYPYDSQERYARRHYELQTDIKQGLQTLATDVATELSGRIGSKLTQALEENLVPEIKNLSGWIEKQIEDNKKQQSQALQGFDNRLDHLSNIISTHFENSQEKQTDAMKAVLEHFTTSVTDTFSSHIDNMGRIIEETIASQKEIKQQLVDFSEILQKQLSSQSEMIDKTNKAGEILGESLASLEAIAQKLKASSDDIGSAAELLESSANSAKEGQSVLQETMKQQVDNMASARKELDAAWQTVTDNANYLVEKIRETINELTTGVQENLIHALQSFDGKIAEVVERFSGTLYDAGETISDMPGLMASINESLKVISEGISEQREMLKEIRETSQSGFSENIQMACDASRSLGECTNNMASTADQLNQFLETFSQKMEESSQKLENRNQEALSGFRELMAQMTGELDKIYGLLNLEGPIYEALKDLEKKIEDANKKELGTNIAQKISPPIDRMSERFDKLANTLAEQPGNGDGDGKIGPEVLQNVTNINDQLVLIVKHLNNDVSPRLKNLSDSMVSLTSQIEKMSSAEEDEAHDNKWWRSLRGHRK